MYVTKEQIKQALKATGGFRTHAAEKLGISYNTLKQRIYKNKDLQQTCEEIRESHIDLAESKLMKKLKEEEPSAIYFTLKCLGKSRGYIEKQQLDHSSSDASMSPPKQTSDVEMAARIASIVESAKQREQEQGDGNDTGNS